MAGLTKNPRPSPAGLLTLPAPLRTPFHPGYPSVLTMNGRNAIHLGLSALGVKPGATVLLPSFHCTALVDPVIAYGAKPAYYPVRGDLGLDLDRVEAELVRTRAAALLCVHFFGWPAPVAELAALCARHGAALIEDCTHTLFGTIAGRPVGSFGDVAVFSFRKILPVQDGGALVLKNPRAAFPKPHAFAPLGYQLRMAKWTLDASRAGEFAPQAVPAGAPALLPVGAVHSAAAAARGPDSQEDPSFIAECLRFPMSLASRLLLASTSPRKVAEARRRNHAFLARRLSGIPALQPCFPALPEGAVPMGFPCLAGDGTQRWDYRLRARGVPVFSFGEVLHATLDASAFPETRDLSARLVLFPVHQGLDEAALETIAQRTRAAFAGAQ
jgi:dTDP-4-amino-4,6-dideoxygalactose transaminase